MTLTRHRRDGSTAMLTWAAATWSMCLDETTSSQMRRWRKVMSGHAPHCSPESKLILWSLWAHAVQAVSRRHPCRCTCHQHDCFVSWAKAHIRRHDHHARSHLPCSPLCMSLRRSGRLRRAERSACAVVDEQQRGSTSGRAACAKVSVPAATVATLFRGSQDGPPLSCQGLAQKF